MLAQRPVTSKQPRDILRHERPFAHLPMLPMLAHAPQPLTSPRSSHLPSPLRKKRVAVTELDAPTRPSQLFALSRRLNVPYLPTSQLAYLTSFLLCKILSPSEHGTASISSRLIASCALIFRALMTLSRLIYPAGVAFPIRLSEKLLAVDF